MRSVVITDREICRTDSAKPSIRKPSHLHQCKSHLTSVHMCSSYNKTVVKVSLRHRLNRHEGTYCEGVESRRPLRENGKLLGVSRQTLFLLQVVGTQNPPV